MTESAQSLISGRRLVRSSAWNIGGMVAPVLVAIVTIPILIEGLGKERFGLLTIMWMGVGYFSLFDMGLGRALTKLVADRLGDGRTDDLRSLIWTAFSLITSLGVLGTVTILLGVGPIVRSVLNVDSGLEAEAINAFRVLALGLPVVVLTSALTGLLQAHQRFASIAAIRVPLGVLTFAGPVITLQFTPSLAWATCALLVARLLAAVAFYLMAAATRKELHAPIYPRLEYVGPLFRFGGWLTVTNIVGPLMVYFDRFLVGSVLTMTAVTYYVTPYEVVTRAQMLPRAVMAVLFPAMATTMAADRKELTSLYRETSRVLFLLILPVVAAFFLFAPEGLEAWLGQDFRDASTPVVRWLALGLLMNTLARTALTVVQSAGRPELIAFTHCAELVPYVLGLWWLTTKFGIAGTAMAWCIRALLDAVLLNEVARRQIPEVRRPVLFTYGALFSVLVAFAGFWFVEALSLRSAIFVAVVLFVVLRGWPLAKSFLRTESHQNAVSPR